MVQEVADMTENLSGLRRRLGLQEDGYREIGIWDARIVGEAVRVLVFAGEPWKASPAAIPPQYV